MLLLKKRVKINAFFLFFVKAIIYSDFLSSLILLADEKLIIKNSCCGSISSKGEFLLKKLNESDVESLWLTHQHVNWETGKPDKSVNYKGPGRKTHCSAFAAAMAKQFDIYMLRPPEHSQILLASAQIKWFKSSEGIQKGWKPVESTKEAQTLANEGNFVVASFESPGSKKAGHIVIIRPSEKSFELLNSQGPDVTQAGSTNKISWYVKAAFQYHKGAWPNGIKYYFHTIEKFK